ncbi:winged helix-turn-helix domain-containing protein [Nonomuraea roseoviolacea]|uniref:winged helix-turn-helix domain-containing protein n=1 Tax=Nonomuraea roseoviolacea TaxID=103837 RepID=UPI0031D93104
MDFRPDELKWEAVVAEVRRRIAEGIYRPGNPIPGEPRLAEELGVSKGTARRAINALIEAGDVYTVLGKGTFVSYPEGSAE